MAQPTCHPDVLLRPCRWDFYAFLPEFVLMPSMLEFACGPHPWKPRRRVEGRYLRNWCRDDEPLGAASRLIAW
jgi:hypothetical protein